MTNRTLMPYGVILLTYFAFSIARAYSYGIEDRDLPTKIEQSDLVVVGIVAAQYRVSRERWDEEYAVVEVEEVLKGEIGAGATVRVIYKGAVSEAYAVCCEKNGRYLLFLDQIRDQVYKSVNGRYGIYHAENGRLSIGEEAADFSLDGVRSEIANGKP